MDNKKFEQLIDLIINEDEDKARALFHDIVVEKSREIYESIMDEEFRSEDQVETLQNEIGAEEVAEEDEFADIEGEDEVDLDADEMGDLEGGEEDLEDRVVDLEDKLDELMAEFEQLMAGEEGEEHMGGEEDFGDEGDEMMEAADDEEESLEESADDEEDDEEEETLEEAVQLQKVSVTHGDNGQNTKSIVSNGPKVSGNGAKAVNFTSGDGGKGGTQGGLLNPATKDLKGAGSFKNAPGKGNFSEKGEAAPKPKHGDNGQNTKSIVGEGKKSTKRIVK